MSELTAEEDLALIKDTLIVLGGYLPFFSGDSEKVARAKRHAALEDEAFLALGRIAGRLGVPVPKRVISKERQQV